FIRKNIAEHKDLKRACEDLMERCLSKTGEGIGTDNMTVIIVGFLHNKTETDWYKWMESRYGVIGPEYKDSLSTTNNSYENDDLDDYENSNLNLNLTDADFIDTPEIDYGNYEDDNNSNNEKI
ncbi:25492_t:CDS:1, partial [Gigaspora margarita]